MIQPGTVSASSGTQGISASPRKVSMALAVGIVLLPPIFAWFLLRKGYTTNARVFGLGWAGLFLAMSQVAPHEHVQSEGTQARLAAKPIAATSSPPKEAPLPPDTARESDYLNLLAGTLEEVRRDGLVSPDPSPQVSWATSLNKIGTLGTNFAYGKDIALSPAAIKRQRAWQQEVAQIQERSFPRLRVLQAKALDQALWELDVRVEATGPAYSVLRLTGYQFAANRNIKGVMDKIHEDVLASRFPKVEFQPYRGGSRTFYALEPLPDTALATFADNHWTPVGGN